MSTKGKKRLRNQAVLYSEVKQKRTLALTPTAWSILENEAIKLELSMQECLEQLIRKLHSE